MYYVGIDVSKHFHVAYVIDENENIISSITFENNVDGYNKFISVLENINKDFRFSAALEATGIYFENLFLFLKEKLDKLILINPFISNKFREFNNMNKTKNDKIDALNIAKLIKNNNIISSNVSDEFIAEMKYLNRFKLEKQKLLKNYKKELSELLCVVFPEYEKVFKNIFSKTSLTLLKHYPTAFHFKKTTPKKLVKLFRNIKGNNFNEQKAKEIISLSIKKKFKKKYLKC
jgi:transposase